MRFAVITALTRFIRFQRGKTVMFVYSASIFRTVTNNSIEDFKSYYKRHF